MTDHGSALVLGGGGVTGIAWALGILYGLAEAGADLTGAGTVIGTSAGAVVGVLATTDGVAAGFAAQHAPPLETSAKPSPSRMLRLVAGLMIPRTERRLAHLGRLALRTPPLITDAQRLADVGHRLGSATTWPDRDLRVTAVEAETGRFTVFDRRSGVDLVAAVAASCAVPALSPPVTIGHRQYMDGGMRSPANADLARGAERIVVIAPRPRASSRDTAIEAQLAATGATHTVVITPDTEAQRALGRNPFDLDRRAAAADAGTRQAPALLPRLEAWLVA